MVIFSIQNKNSTTQGYRQIKQTRGQHQYHTIVKFYSHERTVSRMLNKIGHEHRIYVKMVASYTKPEQMYKAWRLRWNHMKIFKITSVDIKWKYLFQQNRVSTEMLLLFKKKPNHYGLSIIYWFLYIASRTLWN